MGFNMGFKGLIQKKY